MWKQLQQSGCEMTARRSFEMKHRRPRSVRSRFRRSYTLQKARTRMFQMSILWTKTVPCRSRYGKFISQDPCWFHVPISHRDSKSNASSFEFKEVHYPINVDVLTQIFERFGPRHLLRMVIFMKDNTHQAFVECVAVCEAPSVGVSFHALIWKSKVTFRVCELFKINQSDPNFSH